MSQNLWRSFHRSALGYFLLMLVKPAQAIERILTERPSFWSLVLFMTIIGLSRGVIESLLSLLTEGQLFAMWYAGRIAPWLIFTAYPLLLADWLSGYARWLGFALVPYVVGRFCGGQGRLVDFLRVYGIVLGIYVVTILPNFAYFFAPLPIVRFHIAPFFKPTLGIGNLMTSGWLVWVTYLAVRRVHGLPAFEALALGILTPALNIAALVLPGTMLFRLVWVQRWLVQADPMLPLLGFSAVCTLVLGGMVALARRLWRAEAPQPLGPISGSPPLP